MLRIAGLRRSYNAAEVRSEMIGIYPQKLVYSGKYLLIFGHFCTGFSLIGCSPPNYSGNFRYVTSFHKEGLHLLSHLEMASRRQLVQVALTCQIIIAGVRETHVAPFKASIWWVIGGHLRHVIPNSAATLEEARGEIKWFPFSKDFSLISCCLLPLCSIQHISDSCMCDLVPTICQASHLGSS